MRVVAVLAVAGLITLIVALVTGSTWAALAVIALAVMGIVRLLRDWRTDRIRNTARRPGPVSSEESDARLPESALTPDDFSPDLSTDPDGPSSDARADQS